MVTEAQKLNGKAEYTAAEKALKKRMARVQKDYSNALDNAIKTLASFTDAQGKYTREAKKNINILEDQADTLKKAQKELNSYGNTLESIGGEINGISRTFMTSVEKTLKETDKAIKGINHNIKVSNSVLTTSEKISERVRKGLKDSNDKSERYWKGFEKARLNSSKKYYADLLEEEQRAMSDRVSWMENYLEDHYENLSEIDREFYENQFDEYKRRADELEDLVKVAGAEITNNVETSIRGIIDKIRDAAIVTALASSMSDTMDSYIENKHQVMSRTGRGFDFDTYRNSIETSAKANSMLAFNEWSEVYSDIIKDMRMQDMSEVQYFAEDIAAQVKAYGMSANQIERIFWADKNSGMQNRSYHSIMNIAASLENNENLYVDATRLLSSINDNIDNISYLQYEDAETYAKMYKSLATIEALSESSAMKGTEDLINAVREMGTNVYDMRNSDFAKQFAIYSGVGSVENLAEAVQTGKIDELLINYQKYFQSMDDATLAAYVNAGKTPWSSFATAKEFTNDALGQYLNEIGNSLTSAGAMGNLTAEKGSVANTWWKNLKNSVGSVFGSFFAPLGELDVNLLNMAASVTVAQSAVDILRVFKNSKLMQGLLSTSGGKAVTGFFTNAGATMKSLGSTLASGFSNVVGSIGGLGTALGIVAAAAAAYMIASRIESRRNAQHDQDYAAGVKPGNTAEASNGVYSTQQVRDFMVAQQNTPGASPISGLSDYKDLDDLYAMGFVNLMDTNSDGKIDSASWTHKVAFDENSMWINKPDKDDVSTWYVEDQFGNQWKSLAGSYANGLSNVPNNGFAYLHAGEAVLTRDQAVTARADGGISIGETEDFRESTLMYLYSALMTLKDVKETLSETLSIQEDFFGKDEKYKKKIFKGSAGTSGGGSFWSAITGGGSGVAKAYNQIVDTITGGSKAGAVTGNDAASKAWNFFASKGLSAEAIAGILGNLSAESGLSSGNLENSKNNSWGIGDSDYTSLVDSGKYDNFANDWGGYGIAQWTFPSRKQGLIDLANERETSISDLDTQLEFLWKELNSDYYNSVLVPLMQASTVEAASNIMLHNFENPEDQSASVEAYRAGLSNSYLDKFKNFGSAKTALATSVLTGMSEYAKGTPWVASDQVAVIHQGEMIVPADLNPFNSSYTASDAGELVDVVRWMVSIMSSKFDAVLNAMSRSQRNSVAFNSDQSYIYSR